MNVALLVFIICFVLIFILRMPVAVGMMTAGVFYFVVSGGDPKFVASSCLRSLSNEYILIAVPLYIFAANIMNSGKITEMIFDFSMGLVGRLHGGLAHVNILGSLVFSGMTGSALADAAGLGKIEIEAMRKQGYGMGFSCAMTAASATIGPIFPPSIPMVIFATLSGASVGALFMAGMVPGVLLALGLMAYVFVVAKKRNYPRSPVTNVKAYLWRTLKSLPALLTPVILLLGIYTGVMTPTEAGAVAGLYALLLGVFAYRILDWKELKAALIDTAKSTGVTASMVGSAAVFTYIIAQEHVADELSAWILNLTQNPYVFLFIVNLVLLVLGMFLSTTVIQLIFLPFMITVARALGIDMVHFGVITTFNIMVGLSTPPYGLLLFITSGLSGTPLKEVFKEILLPCAVMIGVLFVITYFPDTVLFLPRMLLGYQG